MKIIILVLVLFLIFHYFNIPKQDLNDKNILVMFSGGLDSTTALYYLLKNTNSNI